MNERVYLFPCRHAYTWDKYVGYCDKCGRFDSPAIVEDVNVDALFAAPRTWESLITHEDALLMHEFHIRLD